MELRRLLAATVLVLSSAAASATPAWYLVDSNYTAPSFSASWLHAATGCNMGGLYMCGAKERITAGEIHGNLSGGVLTIANGFLTTATQTVAITGGTLGGAYDWFIETSTHGTFQFVDLSGLSMYGASKQPNSFNTANDPNDIVLWGQNFAAGQPPASNRWGLDLYAVRVPAPGTALILAGACALLLLRRRRTPELRRAVA